MGTEIPKGKSELDALYSDDISLREEAAGKYRVFPQKRVRLPNEYKADWQALLGERKIADGEDWPEEITKLSRMSRWPDHAFGTANASCLLIWHRPGLAGRGGYPPAGAYIGPKIPVLGGIPHAQNVFWTKYHPSPSWRNLHRYLPQAFNELVNPWNQVMIACLNPELGATGKIDRHANAVAVQEGGRIDKIVEVCKPKVVVACGDAVHQSMQLWKQPKSVRLLYVSHPLKWGGHGGQFDGPEVVEQIQAALSG